MAVDWPYFSQATITEAKYFNALKAALAERCAAACSGTAYQIDFPADDQWDSITPDLDRLKRLRSALQSLAPRFVRLDDERYVWRCWANFPIAYTAADLMKGDHSLAILPVESTPEANCVLLKGYRTFLENCAWWLKQFRYVNVTPQSFYTRESKAKGHHSVTDSDDWGYEEEGEPAEYYLAHPEHEDLSGRKVIKATNCMADYYHTADWAADDSYSYREKRWYHDTWTWEWDEIEATVHSGLIVRNYSGLAGTLLLVPTYYRSYNGQFPIRNEERDLVETIIPDPPDDTPIDFIAGVCHYRTEHYEKHGNEWLQTYDQDFRGEQWWGEVTEYSAKLDRNGHCVYRKTKWTDDGSRSLVTETEDDWDGWYNLTTHQSCEAGVSDFDGFGQWRLGKSVESGLVPPHDWVEAIAKIDTLPKPDAWDMKPLDLDPGRIHPRDQWRSAYRRSYLRIVPILDFNSSYQYQDNN